MRALLALIDQVIVSGTNFALTIIVGHACGSEGLGFYTLAFSIVVLATGLQQALISTPFTVFYSRMKAAGRAAAHAGGSLVAVLLLVSSVAAATLLITLGLGASGSFDAWQPVSWALCGTLPLLMLKNFARQFDFARFHIWGAIALDGAVSLLTFAALILLGNERIRPETVFVVVGAASALALIVWAIRRTRASIFEIQLQQTWQNLHRDWVFGRWILADQVISIVHLYALHWLLTGLVSPSATGLLTACGSLAAFSSPFLQGMGNLLSPHFAQCVWERGRRSTARLFWQSTFFLVVAMAAFAGLVAVFAEDVLWLLYRNPAYQGFGLLASLLTLRPVILAAVIPAHHGIVALDQPRASACASAIGLVATLTAAFGLIPRLGVYGAAYAALIGGVIELAVLWAFFAMTFRRWDWQQVPDLRNSSRT